MKYGIWRHENALGNSAEQTVNLSEFIYRNDDQNPVIYVECEFQKYFAACISGVRIENIHYYDKSFDLDNLFSKINEYEFFNDVYMPDVYFGNLPHNYPSVWSNLQDFKTTLKFDAEYENKYNFPTDCILIQFREPTYWKRFDGMNSEPSRFVNPEIFFTLALYYADLGYKVIRIGDSKQTPMPIHKNIIDTINLEKTMLDDLWILQNSKVFLSTDSGIWPIAGGMRKNLVLSNVTSSQIGNKPEITNWLDKDTSITILKEIQHGKFLDNPLHILIDAVNKFL